ncbi:dicarboxylate/amino acid:cation symporter [candidate division KSB1 bacterium]|nr:dicarboxylate/amino acid:cation symporter [candidate division KSB1 bacterium]
MKRTKLQLSTQIFIGMAVGALLGFILTYGVEALASMIYSDSLIGGLHKVAFRDGLVHIADFFAQLFLRMLKMIIAPLIITSIVSGVTGVGQGKNLGRLGLKTLFYYISTSLLAILTGLIMVNIIRPGVGAELGLQEVPTSFSAPTGSTIEFLMDFMQRLIPTNPFEAIVEGNMLQIIFFSLLFGIFITQLKNGKYRTQLTDFFQAAFEAMMKLTHFIIQFAPLGICGIVAKIVATTGFQPFISLGIYFLCVLGGLLIHATITLPFIIKLVGRSQPWHHIRNMSPALLMAFSTSSSSATLPLTMECAETRAKISNKITSFVLPLGATVNMDGTALYECVAAIFIAQAYGIQLGFAEQFIIVITSLMASIGAAGIPMAGLVMITIILRAVGLPLEGIGLILAVDRVLDMCRTTVNVWSDSSGALVIGKTEGEVAAS